MSLHGNLKDFSLSQLFNIISLAKKNGALIIECNSESFSMCFRNGKLIYDEMSREDNSLASVLFISKHINKRQFSILKEKANSLSDKELGIILVNAGYVRQDEIIKYFQSYYLSIVKRLYTKNEGRFYFDQNKVIGRGKISVQISLDNLIIESSRYVREAQSLENEIPNLDMSIRFRQRPRSKIENINLSADEWRVISLIKPGNTIKEIAVSARLNDYEIRRIIYSLVQAGIIEIERPVQVNQPKKVQAFTGVINKTEQKKMVLKLIDRVRSL